MKTKLILAGCMALAGVQMTLAQNASEYNNNAAVNGVNTTAFGFNSLVNTGGSDANNTALGWQALYSNIGSSDNTASGAEALFNNKTGSFNTAHGSHSLFNNVGGIDNTAAGYTALFSNTTGNYNAAFGKAALYFNNGDYNSAFGDSALNYNITGGANSAFGHRTLFNNIGGSNNVAVGSEALFSNTNGYENVAVGINALYNNTASQNIGIGVNCLYNNTTGIGNTATGYNALYSNIDGDQNTANGFLALLSVKGSQNTGIGSHALWSDSTGFRNTAVGMNSIANTRTGNSNIGIGFNSLSNNVSGSSNSAIGTAANVSIGSLNNATALGSGAIVNVSNKIRFGNTAVTVVEGPVAYTISDGRFKSNVKNDDVKGLEFIKKLRPVVYNFDTKKFTEFLTKNMSAEQSNEYMNEDFKPSTDIRQSGFIAQEVEQAAKESGYDFNGVHKPVNDNDNYSLAYSQFVVPLVKAVQEQQAMIEAQSEKITALEKLLAELQSARPAPGAVSTSLDQLNGTEGFNMAQNVPNPFTHETVIKYTLPVSIHNAYMAVYDLSGRQLTTFALAQKGASSLTITSEKLAPGIYIYSIVADGSILDSKRMVVADK